ncbi:hypothetical protein BGZ61DRAFT_443772 [Ilyonectria robusta]|uniref:uncharacterized protein n=1 Tax=Ilyonectria robusta TaxID=1079257 RepID=UPI001E8D6856|nr:uncharacterized protein BGZ61DRAFT_443772 [Ilyonectria robusta]KAH8735134.1 hypothetical protein BGZ61DRAFT_443772 [Ilyonectria robusta]
MTGRCRPGLWRPAQPLQAAKFPHVSPPCDPHALVLACLLPACFEACAGRAG